MTQYIALALICWLCWTDLQCRLVQAAISWYIEPTSWLTFMRWRVGFMLNRHVGSRLLTATLTCLVVCWVNMLVVCWIDFLFGDELTYWLYIELTCWLYVESTSWLTFTNWCIDMLIGVLNWPANFWTVLLNAIVVDQLLHLVIKRNKKKKLYIYYIFKAGWKRLFYCSSRVKCKTQHHLNEGIMEYIPVKQAL